MGFTVAVEINGPDRYANRLVVNWAAAHLRTDDRQADASGLKAAFLALATLAAMHSATAAAWPDCNAPGMQPPVPLPRAALPYPESARLAGVEGVVEVAFTILRDGSVGWVRLHKAEPSGYFESAARDGVRDWRFEPAVSAGEPAECRMRMRVRFRLEDAPAGGAN